MNIIFAHNSIHIVLQFQQQGNVAAVAAMEDCAKCLSKYFAVRSSEKTKGKEVVYGFIILPRVP